jgi:hypothetical protein
MPKTIEFHNTPALTREVVNNWLVHAKKQKGTEPGQIAILEDVLKLIDVAMGVLQPQPGSSETKKS